MLDRKMVVYTPAMAAGEQAPFAEIDAQPEQRVAILDAGAQYGKVIDRRVRNLAVYSDLLPLDTPYEELENYDAFILSGGPESVYAPGAPQPDARIWESGKPLLGICYGFHLINQAYGGSVEKKTEREDGPCTITVNSSDVLFSGLADDQPVLMSHGDSIASLAPGFHATAMSGEVIAGIADDTRRIYGVQFHPEVDMTEAGTAMLDNFLFGAAELSPTYQLHDRLEAAIDYIRRQVGNRHVLSFASGGVDSTVCTVMLAKALRPEQIHAVHVDTGFMRHQESDLVQVAMRSAGIELDITRASDEFYNGTTVIDGTETAALQTVTDPEIKRRIIGDTFMKVMERVMDEMNLDPDNTVLAQGTLRPDLIESASHMASSKADVIKTHHNDTQLVRELRARGGVIEPLQELHKDEVRQLGEKLGLPAELVWRQPFPGPGLAIRLLCAEKPYMTDSFEAIGEMLKTFEEPDIAAHLLPFRTVGVQGDGRTYSYAVGLSGAADWPRLLQKAQDIPKKLHDVNRVVYVHGDKLAGGIHDITPTHLTPDSVAQLREADQHVNDVLREYNLMESLSQVPVISFPVHFGEPGKRSIGIRTFITNDFMTGVPAVPGIHIPEAALAAMVQRVRSVSGIARVAYDLTSKPPGTTEWE